jgi:hypothetical protein
MEEAVPATVSIDPFGGARDHVVPLQDLVEDDAVDEAAEAEPEHDSGPGDRPRRDSPRGFTRHSFSVVSVCTTAMSVSGLGTKIT